MNGARFAHIDQWRTPASEYARTTHRRARVRTRWYSPGGYDCYLQRGYLYFIAERRLYITCLEIDRKTWMVDDPPHWWAMEDHARHYSGHVLCAGLGLGLIVHTLSDNMAVDHITVVERERDVIELIGPQVPQHKLTIIEGDFHKFSPADFSPVDGVFYDLYVGNAFDLLGDAGRTLAGLMATYSLSEDFPIRIHGFSQSIIRGLAKHLLFTGGEMCWTT